MNPWLTAKDLTGFIFTKEGNQIAACSFYRRFSAEGVTSLKIGQKIYFRTGFNLWQTSTALTPTVSGYNTEDLSWILFDNALYTKATLTAVAVFLASLV